MTHEPCTDPACREHGIAASNRRQSEFYATHDRTIVAGPDEDDSPYSLPPEGWSEPDSRGHVTFVKHGASVLERPPARDGFVPYFIGRQGVTYTRWTYKPVRDA